jgi:hypothetical protein
MAHGWEKKKKKEDKVGGGQGASSPSPGMTKMTTDGGNEGATAEPILRVSHNQSSFAPMSTTILTLVDHPLLDANGDGEGGGQTN